MVAVTALFGAYTFLTSTSEESMFANDFFVQTTEDPTQELMHRYL